MHKITSILGLFLISLSLAFNMSGQSKREQKRALRKLESDLETLDKLTAKRDVVLVKVTTRSVLEKKDAIKDFEFRYKSSTEVKEIEKDFKTVSETTEHCEVFKKKITEKCDCCRDCCPHTTKVIPEKLCWKIENTTKIPQEKEVTKTIPYYYTDPLLDRINSNLRKVRSPLWTHRKKYRKKLQSVSNKIYDYKRREEIPVVITLSGI